MPEAIDFLVFCFSIGLIFFVARRAWRKADLQEKFAEAAQVEKEYETVSKFEENFKDLPQKVSKVNEFKKKTL